MRIVLLLFLLLTSSVRAADPRNHWLQGVAQGTTYHIRYVAPKTRVDAETLQADLDRYLAEVDREMSTYRDDSEITRFNRAPAGEWYPVSRAVVEVVQKSREISEATGGAQDITVGPLVELWHFGPKRLKEKAPSPSAPLPKGEGGKRAEGRYVPPSDEEVCETRKRVGYRKLEARLDPPALKKDVAGLEIDLNSIASGYTIDHLGAIMRRHGVTNYMVELGGELCAAGHRSDGEPWQVAIERPVADKNEMERSVPLLNGAMATAGGSRHFYEYRGHKYSHIIDPSTGRPVEHALMSVTVAADKCFDADGWDTPLVVLGPKRGMEVAEKCGIAALFISHGDAGDEARTTSAWRKRFGGK